MRDMLGPSERSSKNGLNNALILSSAHRLPVRSREARLSFSKSERSVSVGTSLGERGRGDCLKLRRPPQSTGLTRVPCSSPTLSVTTGADSVDGYTGDRSRRDGGFL